MKFHQIVLLILISTLLLRSKKVYSQNSIAVNQNYKLEIGIGAGFTTGYGLSFRYIPSKFGMQLNFAPYKSKYSQRYSLGLTFLYKIIDGKNANLFLYQGNHYNYYFNNSTYHYTPEPNSKLVQDKRVKKYINSGIGFGFEFIFLNNMSFNVMAGMASYQKFTIINMTAETGLYYKF